MGYVINKTRKYQLIGIVLAIMVGITGHRISRIEQSNNLIEDDGYREWDFSGPLSLSQEIAIRSNDILYITMHATNISIPLNNGHYASTPVYIPGTTIQGFIALVIKEEQNVIEYWLKQNEEQRVIEITGLTDSGLFTSTSESSTSSSEMASLAIGLSDDLSSAKDLKSITQEEFNKAKVEGLSVQYSLKTHIIVVYRDGSMIEISTYGNTFLLHFIKLEVFISDNTGITSGPIWKDERADYPTYSGDITTSPLLNFIDSVSSLVN